MIVVNKTAKERKFNPITIEITIESLAELETLWHRFNLPLTIIRKNTSSKFGNDIILIDDYDIFDLIDNIAISGGYKK